MSGQIRIDVTGKNAEVWNRVFDSLADIIDKSVQQMMPSVEPDTRTRTAQAAKDVAEITKDWLKAKLESPSLDNEQKIADIAAKFEEIKLMGAQREGVEIDTERKRLELDKARFRYWVERLTTAMKLLCLFESHFIRNEDGSATLLLTNENIIELQQVLKDSNDSSEEWKPPSP